MKSSPTLPALLLLALLSSPAWAEDPPVFLLKWGNQGSGPGQFQNPVGIGVDPDGDIYVADPEINRIQRFTSDGAFICSMGSFGTGNGQFDGCVDIAFGPDRLGYVSDYNNGRIQVFDTGCTYIRQWDLPSIWAPSYMAVDPRLGRAYTNVANYVFAFDTSGTFFTSWPFQSSDPPLGPQPFGLGPSGILYFPDGINSKVLAYDSNGVLVRSWGEPGSAAGQLSFPYKVIVDSHENVYVVDGPRIQKFTSTGLFLTSWGSEGPGDGQFSALSDLCVDADGNVYVLDRGNYRVQMFGPAATPTFQRSWGALKQLYRTK